MSTTTYDPASIAQQLVGITATQTVTNKRVPPRNNTATNYTTSVTFDFDSYDIQTITAQAGALLFNNPTYATALDGEMRMVRIKDSGTARALTYGANFAQGAVALPTTTTISKWLWIIFQYSTTDSKWYCNYASNQL